MCPHSSTNPSSRSLSLTVQLSLPPTLYLEGLPQKYVAVQLHLHWGERGSRTGSEHQINSKASAAEVPESEAWTSTWCQAGSAPGKGGPGNWQSHRWKITLTLWADLGLEVGVVAAEVRAFGSGEWRKDEMIRFSPPSAPHCALRR